MATIQQIREYQRKKQEERQKKVEKLLGEITGSELRLDFLSLLVLARVLAVVSKEERNVIDDVLLQAILEGARSYAFHLSDESAKTFEDLIIGTEKDDV